MREILFRAKTVDNKWHYGFPVVYDDNSFDFYEFRSGCVYEEVYKETEPKTLGQYTGLTDKNGTKIFEGDILKPPCWYTKCNLNCVCIYAEEHTTASIQGFALYHKINDCVELVQSDEWDEFEVIGNIHDNPELLGE